MNCLGIFAKQPLAGQAKTRLATPAFGAQVAAAFLRDTLDRLAAVSARRVIVYTPAGADSFFHAEAAGRFELWPQVGLDLGARLAAFFDRARELGASCIVAVGTDSPTLPVEYVTRAFTELESADVVLGPATDGGYYLVGLGRRPLPIFDDIAWSSPDVLEQTLARIDPDARLALLPPWYDVDTEADWRMLRGHVTALRHCGIDPQIPRTEALLRTELEPARGAHP